MADNVENPTVPPENIAAFREKFFEKKKDEVEKGAYDDRDLERLRNDDLYVSLFLKARYNHMEMSVDCAHESLAWRKESGIRDIKAEDLLQTFNDRASLFYHGTDKFNRPLLWFKGKLHKKDSALSKELKLHIAWHFEQHFMAHPGEQIAVVFDMAGSGLMNVDMDTIFFIVTCFKTYYPNILAYLLVFELPWILQAAWKIVKSWLSPKAVARIRFVGLPDLESYVEKDNLPAHMGGTDTYTFVHEGPKGKANPGEDKKKVTFVDAVEQNELPSSVDDYEASFANDLVMRSFSDCSASAMRRGEMRNDKSVYTGSLITISPGVELEFFPDPEKESQQVISLVNITNKYLAFKVKTTSPQKYKVRPSSGRLDPGGSVDINVFLQTGKSNVSKDKFLVMSMTVNENVCSSEDLAEAWKLTDKSLVHEHRLRCTSRSVEAVNQLSNGKSLDAEVIHLKQQIKNLTLAQQSLKKQVLILISLFVLLLAVLIALAYYSSCDTEFRSRICQKFEVLSSSDSSTVN